MNKTRFLLFLSLFVSFSANAASLCLPDETVSFACSVGKKSISVCSANGETVIYRFGTKKHLEMELESPVHFSRTAYSGGGEGNLTFFRGNHKYIVYSSISNGEWLADGTREKIERAGVYVVKDEKRIADVMCKSFSGENFITDLPPHEEEEFQYYD